LKIKTISNTSFGKTTRETAWESSRPGIFADDNLIKLDLPVNEFEDFYFEIESTILEREIFSSMRNHVMWAQTSRVTDPKEFCYPELLQKLEDSNGLFENARTSMQLSPDRQDEYRMFLPVLSLTKYCIRLSLRDLIKIGKLFLEMSEDISIHYDVRRIFGAACSEIDSFILKTPYSKSDFSSYKTKTIKKLNSNSELKSGIVGDYLTISETVPFSLFAQLQRHRSLLISSNLIDLFSKDSGIQDVNLGSDVNVSISGHISDWEEAFSKRSCWISHYGLWSDIISKIERYIGHDLDGFLPCKSGSCPFNGDAMLRVEGKDPNPPCPIHMRINKIAPTDDQFDEMRSMIYEDKRPQNFWHEKINTTNL